MLPAVAQGAIGIEIKIGNHRAQSLVEAIHHQMTGIAIACERAFLAKLEGSCRTPIAGHATISGSTLSFRGQILSIDGKQSSEVALTGPIEDAAKIGNEAAVRALAKRSTRA